MSQDSASDGRSDKPFSVRKLIVQVLDETNIVDTNEIVAKVTAMLTPEQHAEAFRQAMHELVRQETNRHNVGPLPKVADRPRPSWRVEEARTVVAEAWRRVLRDRIAVADNVRKMLGECTYADLVVAANERFAHAQQNQAKGEWFARLAEAVKLHKAPRLDALPEDVLREVIES